MEKLELLKELQGKLDIANDEKFDIAELNNKILERIEDLKRNGKTEKDTAPYEFSINELEKFYNHARETLLVFDEHTRELSSQIQKLEEE